MSRLFMHEKNIINKFTTGYKGKGHEIQHFYQSTYKALRDNVCKLTFNSTHKNDFDIAARLFTEYYDSLQEFSRANKITSQSKLESTFLEEISCYLFKDIDEIKNNDFGIYNKGVFAGLMIDQNKKIAIIPKDVDFCIGKEAFVRIDDEKSQKLILPIVAVEVKTYMDATMLGEIKSSCKQIRSASPNSKTYVLMGYNQAAEEKIISARNDGSITEMFALTEGAGKPIMGNVLWDYWNEVHQAIENISDDNQINSCGRLISPEKTFH